MNAAQELQVGPLVFTYAGGLATESSFSVRSVSFTARPGEITALIGPSGCGKSTILNLISGKLICDQGSTLQLGGEDLLTRKFGERGTATVEQSVRLLPHLTVWENIALGLHARRSWVTDGLVGRSADSLCKDLDISHVSSQLASFVSGGEAQRAAIGQALASSPRILLMDEPTAALDMIAMRKLVNVLTELKRLYKHVVMVLVSHQRDLVFSLSDKIVVIDDGAVLGQGKPQDLLQTITCPRMAEIIGGFAIVTGKFQNGKITSIADDLQQRTIDLAWISGPDVNLPADSSASAIIPLGAICLTEQSDATNSVIVPGIVDRVWLSPSNGYQARFVARDGNSFTVPLNLAVGASPPCFKTPQYIVASRKNVQIVAN